MDGPIPAGSQSDNPLLNRDGLYRLATLILVLRPFLDKALEIAQCQRSNGEGFAKVSVELFFMLPHCGKSGCFEVAVGDSREVRIEKLLQRKAGFRLRAG